MSVLDHRVVGRQLAEALGPLPADETIVLAIPRSGVVIADQVARRIGAPLDVVGARTVLAPAPWDVAIGAVAAGGVRLVDHETIARLDLAGADVEAQFAAAEEALADEAVRLRGSWPLPEIAGCTAVLVDDGVITGWSMQAAVEALRARDVDTVIVAVAIGGEQGMRRVGAVADRVICLERLRDDLARERHDRISEAICPPLGDDEIHELIRGEQHDVGRDPYEHLVLDGEAR